MPNNGGFPVAFQASTSTLNDMIWFLRSVGDIPSRLTETIDDLTDANGTDRARLTLDVFADAPRLKPDVRSDGNIGATVTGTVNLTIDRHNGAPTHHQLHLRLDLAAAAQADVVFNGTGTIGTIITVSRGFSLVLRITPVLLEDSEMIVLGGDPLTPGWRDFFSSSTFRLGVGFTLGQQLGAIENVLPPDAAPILSGIGLEDGTMSATAVTGPGYVTVGVSVGIGDLALTGDVTDFSDFRDGWDVALWIDPSAEALLERIVAAAARREIDNAVLSNIAVRMKDKHLRISGHADAGAASSDFSFRAKVRLGRPDSSIVVDDQYGSWNYYIPPKDDEIWVEVTDFEADTSLNWAVWLLLPIGWGLLLGGLGFGTVLIDLVRSIITSVKIDAVNQIEAVDVPSRHQRIAHPTDPAIGLDITITSLKIRSDGMTARARVKLEAPRTRLVGLFHLDVMWIFEDRRYDLIVSPRTANLADPTLMLRWRVFRGDTHAVVRDFECGPGMSSWQSLMMNWSSFGTGHSGLSTFVIEARVFRHADGEEQEVHVARQTVRIGDRLDRSYRYVRWTHRVWTMWVEKRNGIPIGSWWQHIERNSQVHRTDVPGRCRFASQYAQTAALTFFDDLGFPWNDLPQHRDQVCEYCFFGGPEKTKPVPEPVWLKRPKGTWVDLRPKIPPPADTKPGRPPIAPGAWLRRGRRPITRASRPPR